MYQTHHKITFCIFRIWCCCCHFELNSCMCICFSYSFWSAHSVKNEQIQQLHLSDISNLINWLKVSPFMDSFFSMFLISSLTMYLISVRNRDRDCWITFILSSISAKNNLLLFLRVLLIGSTTTVLVLMSFWTGTECTH